MPTSANDFSPTRRSIKKVDKTLVPSFVSIQFITVIDSMCLVAVDLVRMEYDRRWMNMYC